MSDGTHSMPHKIPPTICLINKPLGNISIFHLNSSLVAARGGAIFVDIEALETFEPLGQHWKTTKAPHEDKTPGKLKLTLIQASAIHCVCFIVSTMRLLRNMQPAEMPGAGLTGLWGF